MFDNRTVNFKVSLSVEFKKELDLTAKYKDILVAAENFSSKNKHKFLYVHDIVGNTINLVMRIYADTGYNSFSIRFINGFLKKICDIYNIEYNSKHFKINDVGLLADEDYSLLYFKMYELNEKILKENSDNTIIESPNNFETETTQISEHIETIDFSNEIKKIKIPKRTFPSLLRGAPSIFNSHQSIIEYNTLNETLSAMDSLIGIKEAKDQIKDLASFIMRNNERYVNFNIENPSLYYNAAIIGGKGSGKTTLAKILCHIYYHLGVIGKGKFINIDCSSIWAGQKMDSLIGDAQSGVVILDNIQNISFDRRGKADIISTLNEWFSLYKKNFVFFLVGEEYGIQRLLNDENLSRKINIKINIPELSADESIILFKKYAQAEKLTIENSVLPDLTKYINYLKDTKNFENGYTPKLILEKAIFKNGANSKTLTLSDFEFEKNEIEVKEEVCVDHMDELDKLIGLNNVKEKIKEIAAYAKAQQLRKELGLKTGPICLHTCFTGNPGTGKTTVARLLGKIFKEIGVLKTDKFTEVSRQDLVGAYVGHTAMKTEETVKLARGGVLFIDEAYAMKSDSKIDFGHEAIATLIKMMEDMRDNIVIIFAGYTDEMEQFINMNPGLRDRIQFKLEFDDYNAKELMEIWLKFFRDEQYNVNSEAIDEIFKITNSLSINRNRNFSNGRIIRKCFERVKMYQSVRIIKEKLITATDIMTIKQEDIKALYSDKDFNEELSKTSLKKSIGFSV